ncbi:recombinase family protein [Caenibius tardaugens]|nr:recombinase family protein [Caenibius tardaugens]AZI35239.1 recombinase family protein [Caenibius tardaugens NBRC 16725]AZI35296.1 recombinase family protein [Caenibius tardaugens NBRC 16725]
MKAVRCAIYTRKSSEEGLEQGFNSLDAQREACAAYILSQVSEGWQLIPEDYDDGGLSGGTLERPALQRLLAHIAAGRIDIIVVYKVDRLTRSLLDFAKLVEAFDAAGTSFVSVTQSFNTTTSMGRLTLNMLLSFAQFEREVTAERIRDKIAASKARGMWMGGIPPLGYRPDGRSLAIEEDHAALVRDIFARYLKLTNVRLVADTLARDRLHTPQRVTGKGRRYGGCAFTRGQLYAILRNPIYAGDIAHKGTRYPGNHPAIIERETWEKVQQQLSDNVRGVRQNRQARASLLAGLLFDETGTPLIAVHTNKGRQRYRYYAQRAPNGADHAQSPTSIRLPAREIEQVVIRELTSLIDDPATLMERCCLPVTPDVYARIAGHSMMRQKQMLEWGNAQMRALVTRIVVHPDHIAIEIRAAALADLFGIDGSALMHTIRHNVPARLRRTGMVVRLVQDDGMTASSSLPDPVLIRLLVKAQRWWKELCSGTCDIAALARREQLSPSYITRVVRLAFLAPGIVDAITEGRLRAGVDSKALLATGAVPSDWREQEAKYLPG